MGLREHDGDGARVLGLRRHAASVLRLHRACRTTAAGAGRARSRGGAGRHEQRLVRHRRRRRLPDGRRSDRSEHRLHRVAGRQHEPLRPAHRPAEEHSPERRRRGGAVAAQAPRRPDGCVDGRVGGGGGGGGGGGRGGNASNVLNAQPGEQYRFNWNTPYMLSPHNAEHRVVRRQPPVQVVRPRRHLRRERRTSPSRWIAARSP